MVALTPEMDVSWMTLEREVRAQLRRRLGAPRHWHDVDEMTSRVLEAVWARGAECRDVRGMACTIARRRAVDVIRSRGRVTQRVSLEGFEPVCAMPEPPELLEAAERRAQCAVLERLLPEAIGALPTLERNVVEIRYYEGASFNQIDERLGLRKGSAAAAELRARVMLRAALSGVRGAASSVLAAAAYAAIMAVALALPLFLSPATASAAQAATRAAERSPFGGLSCSPLS